MNYQQVSTLIQEENNLVNTYNDSQRKTLTLVSTVGESNLIVQDEIINNSVARSSIRDGLWDKTINPCLDSLEDEQDNWQDVDLKLKFATIRMNLKKLRRYQEEIERLLRNKIAGPSFVVDSVGNRNQGQDEMAFNATVNVLSIYRKKLSGGSGIINQVQAQFEEFEGLQSQDLQLRIDELRSSIRFFFGLYLFLLVAFLALIAYSGWMLLDNILEKINRVKSYVWDFSRGNIPENIEVSKDEVGEVLIGLQDLAQNLEKIKEFAHTVRDGNFDHRLEIIQSKGDLGQSLKEMQEGLLAVARRDQQRNRTNEGIALFGNLLREYNDSQALYDSLVSNLVKYLNANQGGIFILNDHDPENEFLELQSLYAFNRIRFEQKSIHPGQGLVGQSWLEKDVIYLEETDIDYVQIVSGLGGAKPRSILIVPLINNESKVLGALE
ncbi:MAG: GAF domain-containing protein, partial [Bacteroidota bacterium]